MRDRRYGRSARAPSLFGAAAKNLFADGTLGTSYLVTRTPELRQAGRPKDLTIGTALSPTRGPPLSPPGAKLPAGGGVSVAVVAEKPSVARDIARVLGARTRGEGRLTGNGYVVTWAIGHLVALAQPHEIRAEWKRWAAGVAAPHPRGVAAGRSPRHPGAVRRGGAGAPRRRGGRGGVRHGRRARGRADLPLSLREGRLPEAGAPPVAFVADPRRDSPGVSAAPRPAASSIRSRTPRAAAAGPTGSSA